MTSAATHAPEPVMWCAMLKRPIIGSGAVRGGEREGHPGADPGDPHASRKPAGAAQRRPSVPRRSRVARPPTAPMAAPASHAEQLQRDVVAAGRYRMQEHDGGGAHGQHRDGQGAQVE